MDLRQRVVHALQSGESIAAVARKFSIARPTVYDWRDRAEQDDLSAGKPGPRGPRKFTPDDDALIRRAVAAKPGITARELVAMLNGSVSVSAMCDRLNKLDLPLKKRR
jgi:transposase